MTQRVPLDTAIRKLTHMGGRRWGGYLLPIEAKLLVEKGCTPAHKSAFDQAISCIAEGTAKPSWIYFSVRENTVVGAALMRKSGRKKRG